MGDSNDVNQSNAAADGDVVGRDKVTTNFHYRRSKIEVLLERLGLEDNDGTLRAPPNETLQYYAEPVADDGVLGLEAKLAVAGRSGQLPKAIREKEQFAKMIEAWAHSEIAQSVLSELLSHVEQKYNNSIYTLKDILPKAELDKLIYTEIIEPLNDKVGDNPLGVCELTISGMVYWLAEKCHIRWH